MENKKNDNPKISIIMTVKNGEKYIKESLESVFKQTLKDLEMKRLQGIAEQMLLPYEQQVINDREALLILIGKLHEYVASLKLELTSNLTKLDNYHKFKISWDGRKSLLEKQVQELS